MARTLNRVQLIGRLGGDPELRHTGTGLPVATFSIATNRQWPGKDGTLQEETEWHTIVAWDKLAQICSEHLTRGRLVYIEGRIHTRSWEANGQKQYKTEIVATDMLILDSRPSAETQDLQQQATTASRPRRADAGAQTAVASGSRQSRTASVAALEDTDPDDLPF
jgi:single-strand DNA-binding protein